MNVPGQPARRPILVVGVGNILLHDEGFGPHMIGVLSESDLPDSVELLDAGTAGADLLDPISDRRKVIFIDTVDGSAAPGALVRLTASDLVAAPPQGLSLHSVGLIETLMMARQLNGAPDEVIVIGVQPKDLSCGLGLSDELQDAVVPARDLVLDELSPETPSS
jgi:hydrogenase maturation protease